MAEGTSPQLRMPEIALEVEAIDLDRHPLQSITEAVVVLWY
jgi:hypothetical protein